MMDASEGVGPRPGELPLRQYLRPIVAELTDPDVTEIVVIQPGEVGIERNGTWTRREVPEFTFDRLDQMGILTAFLSGQDFDGEHPIQYGTLPDGQRATICRPPATALGVINVTIRVPSQKTRTVEDDDFATLMSRANVVAAVTSPGGRTIDQELVALYRARGWTKFFPLCVQRRKNILATGRVGSGKTTFVKRLMHSIPLDERVVTIEDSDEFGVLPQWNRVQTFYGAAGVTAEDAVRLALRQRPDRLCMQELRGAEAFAFVRALLGGLSGGLTTLHSEPGYKAAFDALAVMVKTHPSGREIPDAKLNDLLRSLIDVVVWCERVDGQFSVPYVWFKDAEDA